MITIRVESCPGTWDVMRGMTKVRCWIFQRRAVPFSLYSSHDAREEVCMAWDEHREGIMMSFRVT
jgi:hypothetical protein